MTVDQATNVSAEAVTAAAQAIAEAFGLGDDMVDSEIWPVDEGDTVLAAAIRGDLEGALLLAVNDDVAGRLQSDESRLRSGFQKALDALTESAGLELELGEIGVTDVQPSSVVEISDQGKLTCIFAVHLEALTDDAADGDSPVDAAGAPLGAGADVPLPGTAPHDTVDFQPDQLRTDASGFAHPSSGPLSLLHDVEMDVTVELGRTRMPIRELLSLQPGMVVEIDRVAGAPIDVLVNGHRIACGEVVVIDEEFGIRLTEIVEQHGSL